MKPTVQNKPLTANKTAAPIQSEIAPGKFTFDADPVLLPGIIVADLVPVGGDLYRRVERRHERRLRLTEDLPAKLGLGCSYQTLYRLIYGGFVKGERISPRTMTFDLESYYEHRKRCQDPEWWKQDDMFQVGGVKLRMIREERWAQICAECNP